MNFFKIFFILFIISLYAGIANIRNAIWKDDVSLWKDSAQKSQNKPRPRNNLGGYYMAEKDLENAFVEFKKAIELKPDFVEAISNMGFVYYDMGLINDALNLQEKALKLDPNFRNAHYGYALIMEKLEKYEDAKKSWEMVIKLSKREDKWLKKAMEHIENITQKSNLKTQK